MFDFLRREAPAARVEPTLEVRPRATLEGARSVRRLSSWRPAVASINNQVLTGGETLRARARETVLQNPYADAAAEAFVGNLVGAGIKPSIDPKARQVREAVRPFWNRWTDQADADGLTDFYGLQATVARALFEAGECLIRFRPRRAEDGLEVPLQLQLLESEMLPYELNQQAPNGNWIKAGIEFDAIGRRVAYWFLRRHPGEALVDAQSFNAELYSRVPAAQVLHIYKPLRPGQIRGLTFLKSSLVRLYLLDQFDDATLERMKVSTLFAGFVMQDAGEDASIEGDEAPDADGVAPLTLEPATLQSMLPGEKVEFSDPPEAGTTYEPFQYRNLSAIAAGVGQAYSEVTGDQTKANFASQRTGLIALRRRYEQLQWSTLIFQFCRPVWAEWLRAGALAGQPSFRQAASVPVKWIPPAWPWVDPLKDTQAKKMQVDSLFVARSDVIEEMGFDAEEVDERIAADKAREKRLGIAPVPGAGETQGGRETPDQPTEPQN